MNRRRFLAGSVAAAFLPAWSGGAFAQAPGGRQPLVIGQSIDLSGVMQNIGRNYFTGAKAAFDRANQSGGIRGRQIRFVSLDDGGVPERAAANVRGLINEQRVDVLFGMASEACVDAVCGSDAFRRSGVDLFAPLSGVDSAAGKGRVVYLRPDSATEMAQILGRLSNLSLTRLALVHTASASMVAARNAALAGLGEQGIAVPRSHVLGDGGANAPALIEALLREQTQAVIVMADAFSASALIQPLRKRSPALFVCLGSMVDVETVQQLLGPAGAAGIMVARTVPDPSNTLIPVVANFRSVLARYMDEAPTASGLEGYMAAQALLAVLRRSEDARGLARAAQERVGKMDLDGWKLDLAGVRAQGQIQLSMITREGRFI